MKGYESSSPVEEGRARDESGKKIISTSAVEETKRGGRKSTRRIGEEDDIYYGRGNEGGAELNRSRNWGIGRSCVALESSDHQPLVVK